MEQLKNELAAKDKLIQVYDNFLSNQTFLINQCKSIETLKKENEELRLQLKMYESMVDMKHIMNNWGNVEQPSNDTSDASSEEDHDTDEGEVDNERQDTPLAPKTEEVVPSADNVEMATPVKNSSLNASPEVEVITPAHEEGPPSYSPSVYEDEQCPEPEEEPAEEPMEEPTEEEPTEEEPIEEEPAEEEPMEEPTEEPEEEPEEETEEEEELDVVEKKIGGKMYYVSSNEDKTIYEIVEDECIGEALGRIEKVDGKSKVKWFKN